MAIHGGGGLSCTLFLSPLVPVLLPIRLSRHAAVFAYVLLSVAIAVVGLRVLLTQPVLMDAMGQPLDATTLHRVVAIEGVPVTANFFGGLPFTFDVAQENAWWQLHGRVYSAIKSKTSVTVQLDSETQALMLALPENKSIANDLYLVYASGVIYLIGGLFLYFRHSSTTGFLLTLHLLPAAGTLFAFSTLSLRPFLFPQWPYHWFFAAEVLGNIGYLAGVHYLLRFPRKKRVLNAVPRYVFPIVYSVPVLHAALFLLGWVPYASSLPISALLTTLMLLALIHSFVTERDRFIKLQLAFMLLVVGVGYFGFYIFYAYAAQLSIAAFGTAQVALMSLTSLFAMGATMENVTLYLQKMTAVERSRTEREQLREELHDNVLNRLATIALLSDKALKSNAADTRDEITAIKGEASSYAQYARGLLWITDDTCLWNDFGAHLRRVGYDLTAAHDLDFDLTFAESLQPAQIPLAVKVAVYKIFVEAIFNTLKHAQATQVRARLQLTDVELTMDYADDGLGFDANSIAPGHYGLMHMRRRASEVGGLLQFMPNDSRGARLLLRAPI
jgi:signal transduction histidine kinase